MGSAATGAFAGLYLITHAAGRVRHIKGPVGEQSMATGRCGHSCINRNTPRVVIITTIPATNDQPISRF